MVLASASCAGVHARMPGECEWDQPGQHPFMGDVPSAVDHYKDIPPETRARLKDRMRRFEYDDLVTIRRDAIEGRHGYEPEILAMHFGGGRMCASVVRHTWTARHQELGFVYCESGQCILVPIVCRNVSRITRRPPVVALAPPTDELPPGEGELLFEPPAAGQPPGLRPPEQELPAPPADDELVVPPRPSLPLLGAPATPPVVLIPPSEFAPLKAPPVVEAPPAPPQQEPPPVVSSIAPPAPSPLLVLDSPPALPPEVPTWWLPELPLPYPPPPLLPPVIETPLPAVPESDTLTLTVLGLAGIAAASMRRCRSRQRKATVRRK